MLGRRSKILATRKHLKRPKVSRRSLERPQPQEIRRVPAYQHSEARIIFGDVAPPCKLKPAPPYPITYPAPNNG